jgi:hypothetical protein
MLSQIPTDGTSPLRRALERRIQGSDATVSRLSDELEALDEAVRAVFQAGMQNVMRLVPEEAGLKAERALRSLIMEAVTVTLDEELDTADFIRADQQRAESTKGAMRAQQECAAEEHCGCRDVPGGTAKTCCSCGAPMAPRT